MERSEKKLKLKRRKTRDRVRHLRAKRAKEIAAVRGDQDTTTDEDVAFVSLDNSPNATDEEQPPPSVSEATQQRTCEQSGLIRCMERATREEAEKTPPPVINDDDQGPFSFSGENRCMHGATTSSDDHMRSDIETKETSYTKDRQILLQRLVTQIASIKVSHDISDAAIEDMFKTMCDNLDAIKSLLKSGIISSSYRTSIKPRALVSCPKINCSYVLEKPCEGGVTREEKRDLQVIPRSILCLPSKSPKRLLWTGASVLLKDIADHYVDAHKLLGFSQETLHLHLQSAQVSVDGVRESPKGSRHFIITSIRFGQCIYILNVLHPLLGDPKNAPKPKEILRYLFSTFYTRKRSQLLHFFPATLFNKRTIIPSSRSDMSSPISSKGIF